MSVKLAHITRHNHLGKIFLNIQSKCSCSRSLYTAVHKVSGLLHVGAPCTLQHEWHPLPSLR